MPDILKRKEVPMFSGFRILNLLLILIGLLLVTAYALGQCCDHLGCWAGQVFLCQDGTCRYYSKPTCAFDDNSKNKYISAYTPNPCGGGCFITNPPVFISKFNCPTNQCTAQCGPPVPYPVEAVLADPRTCQFVQTEVQYFCAKK
jgi:hypothetical protein